MMSTPASSTMLAPGASYAVIITSGSAEPLRARTAGTVTGWERDAPSVGAAVPVADMPCLLPSSAPSAAGGLQKCSSVMVPATRRPATPYGGAPSGSGGGSQTAGVVVTWGGGGRV